MLHRLCLGLALALLPFAVSAGPWPRGEGETFLSFSTLVTTPRDAIGTYVDSYTSVFVERGLRDDLTFGLDAGMTKAGAFSAFAFLKTPVLPDRDPHRFALRFGFGITGDGSAIEDVSTMAGGYWGRGFTSRFGSGWATLDLQAHLALDSGQVITKADATIGVKPSDRLKLMLQVQTGDYPNAEPFLRLAPSAAWEMRAGRHIELGAQIGVVGDTRIGLKLGSWFEF